MPKEITGCPGYFLADDKKTIFDENGKIIDEQDDYMTILVDGKNHCFQRAKLAWCALNNINPFEVSDDYIFYYIDGEPRKRSTSAITSQTRLSDIEFHKKLKSWAEKQGFYDLNKYIEAMHDFIQKHKVSLKDIENGNDYVVFKKTTKILADINTMLTIHAEYNDYEPLYLNMEIKKMLKPCADKRKMTIQDYIDQYSWILCLPDNLNDDLLEEVKNEADDNDLNIWEYLVGLHCQNGCLEDVINTDKMEIESLKKENETLKKQLATSPVAMTNMQPTKISPWKAINIQVSYQNDMLKDNGIGSFNIILEHDNKENKNFIKLKDVDKVNLSVDEIINLIKDSELRLTMNNSLNEN